MTGAGVDIWNTSDQFHFAYRPITGDTQIVARVASLQAADAWTKAGIMIRENLTASAAYAALFATGSGGWSLQQRLASGGISYYTWAGAGAAPGWVRLVRTGSLFSAYKSADGSVWTLVGTKTITMGATVYVGLAITSHKAAVAATATFSNVTVSGTTSGGNQAPTVAITAPAGGASYTAPATVAISASAGDTDGTVARVDFYASGTLVGSDTGSPFAASWSNVAAGTYSLTAVATDNAGGISISSAVSITVAGGIIKPPTVSISSPSTGATFTAPASIPISATAADTDGTVTRVDFYAGATLVGSDTASPFSVTWSGVAAGSYVLAAVATDNGGAQTTSAGVPVTVSASNLPAAWAAGDIGSPSPAGSARESGGTFTVTGAGVDIWNTSDQFHFAYRPITGDTQIVARVASLQAADAWTKAGIMIRENLTASAAYAALFATGSGGWSLQQRLVSGGISYYTMAGAGAAPGWVRLVRTGSLFSAYKSADGNVWTLVGTKTIAMGATAYVGLAITSHKAAVAATATFTNVTISGTTSGGGNQAPTVAITAPAGGASYTAPATVAISASAGDTDGTVARVDFYASGAFVGSDTASPFAASWSNVAAGTYSLTAIATDNAGGITISSPVSITVAGTLLPIIQTKLIFTVPADYATNVTSGIVQLRRSVDAPTATPVAARDIGKPPVVSGEVTVDISTLVDPLPSGSYYGVVVVTGPGGSTPSSPSAAFSK